MASVVDYLKGQGKDSSFAARQRLAQQYGIANYSGTSAQNDLLLQKVQNSSPSFGGAAVKSIQAGANIGSNSSSPSLSGKAGAQIGSNQSSTPSLSGKAGAKLAVPSSYAGGSWGIDETPPPEISRELPQQFNYTPKPNYSTPNYSNYQSYSEPTPQPTQTSSQSSSLPQSAEKVLDVLQDHLAKTPVNPEVAITPEMIAKFYEQAKTELEPYYGQLFKQAQEDLTVGFRQISEDLAANERNLESSYGKNLENVQEDAAARGLTFSSIRDTNEKSLAEQTQAAIEAGRREAERRARDLGTQGERQIGSANLPNLPGINEAPTPILNQPGVYSFAKPTGVRDLFKPIGSTTGKLEQDKLAALESRKLDLTNEERKLRSLNTI